MSVREVCAMVSSNQGQNGDETRRSAVVRFGHSYLMFRILPSLYTLDLSSRGLPSGQTEI